MILNLDRKRFEQTVRAYSAEMFRFAYWLCRDRFVAEDIVQEALMRAWNNWSELKTPGAAKAWLMTIVRNEHARLYERKRLDYVDTELEDLQIADEGAALDLLEIEQMLGTLPLSLREPLVLQSLGGFSCAEIAAMLETTEGAIMTRLTRARQALRGTLEAGGQRRGSSQ